MPPEPDRCPDCDAPVVVEGAYEDVARFDVHSGVLHACDPERLARIQGRRQAPERGWRREAG
jgi:hypothetical protein